MAMSRSFGGIWVTSRSPIRIRPSLTSSRPASMRSEVDLPQPDGPTRTRNSPSAISRSSLSTDGLVAPGYTRVALSYVTVATLPLPFTGRNVPDDPSEGCTEPPGTAVGCCAGPAEAPGWDKD